MTPTVGDVWYRYVDRSYAGMEDDLGRTSASRVAVHVDEYRVAKVSAKCAWLVPNYDSAKLFRGAWGDTARRVLLSARKQFACPTRELALASFLARKRRQLSIYEARTAKVREALRIARFLDENPL